MWIQSSSDPIVLVFLLCRSSILQARRSECRFRNNRYSLEMVPCMFPRLERPSFGRSCTPPVPCVLQAMSYWWSLLRTRRRSVLTIRMSSGVHNNRPVSMMEFLVRFLVQRCWRWNRVSTVKECNTSTSWATRIKRLHRCRPHLFDRILNTLLRIRSQNGQ